MKTKLVFPVFEIAIWVGIATFAFGIFVPFLYLHEFMRPHLAPLPKHLSWIDEHDHRTLSVVSVAIPVAIVLFGLLANLAFPMRVRRHFPWWKRPLKTVLRENRTE